METLQILFAWFLLLAVMICGPAIALAFVATSKGRRILADAVVKPRGVVRSSGRLVFCLLMAAIAVSVVQVLLYAGPDIRFTWQR